MDFCIWNSEWTIVRVCIKYFSFSCAWFSWKTEKSDGCTFTALLRLIFLGVETVNEMLITVWFFFAKRPKLSHSELNSTDHAVERQSLAFCQISFQCRNFWNSLISLVCFSFSLFFHSFCFLLSRFWSYSFFRTWLFFNWQTVCFLGTKMIYISIYVGRRRHKNEMKFIQLQLT